MLTETEDGPRPRPSCDVHGQTFRSGALSTLCTPAWQEKRAVQIGLTEVSGVGNGGHMNFSIWMPGGVRGGDPKASLLHKNT